MKVRLRPLLAGVAVAAAVLAVMVLGSGNSTRATSFNPTVSAAVKDPTPGKPSDITATLSIPTGDVNFAAFISYIPQTWGIVTGDHVPIGAPVGTLNANSVLGLINSACNQQLPITFDMMNGSLNMKDTVSFNDLDNNNTADYADTDPNGLFKAVTKYPDWLTRIFKDANGNPIQPIRRSIGVTPVAGTPVILQFLIFPPGTQVDPTNPLIPHDASQGFPSVTVLQNIGDTSAVPAPSIITDFCTPLSTTNLTFGTTPAGDQLLVNPSDGKYTFGTFALGQRDADGDGIENSLDTCAYTPNVGDPRIAGSGDLDNDGLDAACDPNDNASTGTNSDQDGDGYLNRGDNCPLVANGQNEANVPGVGNQKDTDLVSIGDACNIHLGSPDLNGAYKVATPSADITIGAGGTAAGSPPTTAQCPNCWTAQTVINPSGAPTLAPSGSGTPKASGSTSASGTPKISASPPPASSSSSSGTIIAVVVGVVAAVIVIGGGAALLMRRKKSA
jgi:Thrombospondin type 3 repeat